MKRLYTLLPLLLALTSSLFADEEKDTVSNVNLTGIAWATPPEAFVVPTSGHDEEWTVPAFQRSQLFEYSGPRRMLILEKRPEDVSEAEPRTLAEFELPEKAKDVLLLFFPRSDGTYIVYPVPDNPEAYKPGSARIMNVTSQQLAIRAGEQNFTLQPSESRIVAGDGRKVTMRVAISVENEGWQLATSNVLALKPHQRRSVFITSSDAGFFDRIGINGEVRKSRPVQIFSIEDRPPTPPVEGTNQ